MDIFKALSDSTRRAILELLKEKDMNAGEIAEHFQMTKPSVSHHLNILKSSGLIIDERHGQNIVYSLNMTVFQEVIQWVMSFNIEGEKDVKEEF
ncbi:MAG: autorepressor SdpR family transcription factor [Erysipelotrichaceae bacterium]|nr:autorepressor SdpR family transcription factor [Erysipelotrichaceae bacterium]